MSHPNAGVGPPNPHYMLSYCIPLSRTHATLMIGAPKGSLSEKDILTMQRWIEFLETEFINMVPCDESKENAE